MSTVNPYVVAGTTHHAEVLWFWRGDRLHDLAYQIEVNDAVAGAVKTACKRYEVIEDVGFCCQWEGIRLEGDDLELVTRAAVDVSKVLSRFKGICPLGL